MADYAKKKNDELAAICKERNLPHTGKKAELVKRLEEYDAKQTTAPAKPATNEDEIDWDEEPATEPVKPATTEAAADGGVEASEAPAIPAQEPAANTDDLVVEPPAGEATISEEQKAEKDFSSGIADRTIDEEIERLKKRCEKFGLDPNDSEQIKKLERAKKFGSTVALAVNSALKDQKRGREDADDGGIRKSGRGGRGRPGPGRRQSSNRPKKDSGESGKLPSWMTEKDRAAAEKRKQRFASG